MMGPLGLLSPHPGVSYLFSGAEAASINDGDSSLWGIAHASTLGSAVTPNSIYGGGPGSPPPSWTTTLGDTIRQIDHKLKVRGSPWLQFIRSCIRLIPSFIFISPPPPSITFNGNSAIPILTHRRNHNLSLRAPQKLIAILLKELDDCARTGIKDELASLDPLLRHVSVAEEPRDTFEFD